MTRARSATIVDCVSAALDPLVARGIVSGIRLAGVADKDGRLIPILSIAILGAKPETHAAEIGRLIRTADLDVEWAITTSADTRWPRARHIVA